MRGREGRYRTSGLTEAQTEPGSRGRVLKNLLHIVSIRRMELAEQALLLDAQRFPVRHFSAAHQLTESDIRTIHRAWLGSIYAWAGTYRNVNMSKPGLPFPPARLVPRLMNEFSSSTLQTFTPCRKFEDAELCTALATVHTEFILIHPFREGNGRIARWVSNLMGAQAGYSPLNFSAMQGRGRRAYFAAVRSGLGRDYQPMERVFTAVLGASRKRA